MTCRRCGADLPDGARFCWSCGAVQDADDTRIARLPPHETSAAPVVLSRATPRYFGVTPPMVIFALATAALALAFLFAVLSHWVVALVLALVSLLLLLAFVGVARRVPDSEFARSSARAVDRARERAAWLAEAVVVRSAAGREVNRLRRELLVLGGEREQRLRDLGLAVYLGDAAATESLTDAIRGLDQAAAEREAHINAIARDAEERIARGRAQVEPTLIEPPGPVPVPEPGPPPDELTPPTPPEIPEPSPPPDEGTPPQPAPVPEPGPPNEL